MSHNSYNGSQMHWQREPRNSPRQCGERKCPLDASRGDPDQAGLEVWWQHSATSSRLRTEAPPARFFFPAWSYAPAQPVTVVTGLQIHSQRGGLGLHTSPALRGSQSESRMHRACTLSTCNRLKVKLLGMQSFLHSTDSSRDLPVRVQRLHICHEIPGVDNVHGQS